MSVWRKCEVTKAGAREHGRVAVELRVAGTPNENWTEWFEVVQLTQQEILAVALTSIATNSYVEAQLSSIARGSTIERLNILRYG